MSQRYEKITRPKPLPQQPHKQKPGLYPFVGAPTQSSVNSSLPANQSCSTCPATTILPARDSDAIVFRD